MSADAEVAEAVYQETQQQLQDGWVKGPFSGQQLDCKFSGCWIPSKRFGVRQGGKIRAVDDFSEFLINMSVTSTEKLALYGIEGIHVLLFLALSLLMDPIQLIGTKTSPKGLGFL